MRRTLGRMELFKSIDANLGVDTRNCLKQDGGGGEILNVILFPPSNALKFT
jgi:hypothetical protein